MSEAYIHNEDVRRGTLQHPRVVSAALHGALWARLPLFARGLRRVPQAGTLTVLRPDQEQRMVALGRGRADARPPFPSPARLFSDT